MAASDAPSDLAIWCMMETPRGVLNAEAIAGASPRVACFVMGTSDLTKDLHAHHTRDRLPMVTSLGLCILAARAYELAILDGVHLDLADDEGFEFACRQGLEMGFDGKTLIHPKTIDVANRIFAPSEDEVAWSRRIIQPMRTRRRRARAWWWWTASSSRTCTCSTRAASSTLPSRSPRSSLQARSGRESYRLPPRTSFFDRLRMRFS
jgi:citrate lyase beta subunit